MDVSEDPSAVTFRVRRLPQTTGEVVTSVLPGQVPPSAKRTIGGFQVVRELGRGGMSVVLLARDGDLNRLLALKLLRAEDPQTLARFRLEANALARLAHPNAVRVYRFGEDAGQFYLAMEYIEGKSLDGVLRDGPLDARRTTRLLALVAGAVHAAHTSGIVHRDRKPANVLLDGDDNPKITDFPA